MLTYFRKKGHAFKSYLENFCSQSLQPLVSTFKVKVRHSVCTITTTSSMSSNFTSNNQRGRLLKAKFKFLFSFQIIGMSFENWGNCSVWKALAMMGDFPLCIPLVDKEAIYSVGLSQDRIEKGRNSKQRQKRKKAESSRHHVAARGDRH